MKTSAKYGVLKLIYYAMNTTRLKLDFEHISKEM